MYDRVRNTLRLFWIWELSFFFWLLLLFSLSSGHFFWSCGAKFHPWLPACLGAMEPTPITTTTTTGGGLRSEVCLQPQFATYWPLMALTWWEV
jgi:hypothetical protein